MIAATKSSRCPRRALALMKLAPVYWRSSLLARADEAAEWGFAACPDWVMGAVVARLTVRPICPQLRKMPCATRQLRWVSTRDIVPLRLRRMTRRS